MSAEEFYDRREQTLLILRLYLERFAHIVGHRWSSITYIDGFAGPWNVRSDQLEDSSFAIALKELRKARETHAQRGRTLGLRGFFLEKDREAFGYLDGFAKSVQDARIEVLNREFEDSVDAILRFVRQDRSTFPFIFIDPTGWTGFRLNVIRPLLQLNPGEVLINFMTGHIRRFLGNEGSRQGFIDLFGSDRVIRRVKEEELAGIELDDAMVNEYMDAVKRVGRFEYVLSAVVLHPEIERTHFHLIYGTRHPKGVEVFKEAEKIAMKEMLQVRSDAQVRREQERTGQGSLFPEISPPAVSQRFDELRARYLGQGKQGVLHLLERQGRLPYDQAWAVSLSHPLVWESDLKDWIGEWQKSGLIAVEGLQGRERVPRREHDHVLVMK